MSNFSFLQTYWPDFAQIMEFAENYVYTDPASSKNKSGLFVELMVREILRIENLPEPEDKTHYSRTKLLKNEGYLPYDVNQWINQVRIKRNDSAHENKASEQEALLILGFTHHIAVWFMQTYGDGAFRPEQFTKPERPKKVPDYTRLVLNQERKIEEQNETIASKESELAETNALLAERDKLLAEQQALLAEQETLSL